MRNQADGVGCSAEGHVLAGVLRHTIAAAAPLLTLDTGAHCRSGIRARMLSAHIELRPAQCLRPVAIAASLQRLSTADLSERDKETQP